MARSSANTVITLNFDGMDRQPWELPSLARLPIWVGWRRNKKTGRKIPYNPKTGSRAESDNPTTWVTRREAEEWVASNEGDGVGLMLSEIDVNICLAGIDLDTCRDENSGMVEGWAQEVVDRFASYTEISPSGTGVKIFFTLTKSDYERAGTLFDGKYGRSFKNGSGEHPPAIEVHRSRRYFCFTRKRYGSVRDLRRVDFADLKWVVEEAGPRFVGERGGDGGKKYDDTRSGKAWHVGLKMRGETYEALRDALLNDPDPDVREWARTEGMATVSGEPERGLRRIYDKINGDDGADMFDPWSEDRPTPAFPLDTLPRVIREFVEEQARVIGGDISAMAMCCLSALSIAIDHQIQLKMLEHGIWRARPRLWIAIIGDPSTKKSIMIKAALRAVKRWQAAIQQRYKEIKAEAKRNKEPEPERPVRYTIDDITPETVAMIAARSPRGLMVDPDELAGWIGSIDRYNPNAGSGKASPGRTFWIRGYDGGPYDYDRKTSGEIHVENLSVSIIGGIQPDRLAELRGLESDGLLQRFLPIVVKPATFEQDMPCDDRDYAKLIEDLLGIEPTWDPEGDELRPLKMSADGYGVMEDIRRRLFDIGKHGDRVSSGFQTFVQKLPDIAGSLSVILHMARSRKRGLEVEISAETVERAGSIIFDFVIPHALTFYAGDRDWREVRRICGWILKQGKEKLTFRDFIRGPLQKIKSHDEVRRALEPLETIGWLQPAGPWPTKSWKVPARVFEQMKERAEIERRMGEETTALMEKSFAARRAQKDRET